MSWAAQDAVQNLRRPTVTAREFLFLSAVAKRTDHNGDNAGMSHEEIAEVCFCDVRSAYRIKKNAEKKGLVGVKRVPGRPGGRSKVNRYSPILSAMPDAAPKPNARTGGRNPSLGDVSKTGSPDFNRALPLTRWMKTEAGCTVEVTEEEVERVADLLKEGTPEELIRKVVTKRVRANRARPEPSLIVTSNYFEGAIKKEMALAKENAAASMAAPAPVAPARGAAVAPAPSTTNPEPLKPASDEGWLSRQKAEGRDPAFTLALDVLGWAKISRVPDASDKDFCRHWISEDARPDLVRPVIFEVLACGIKPTSLASFDPKVRKALDAERSRAVGLPTVPPPAADPVPVAPPDEPNKQCQNGTHKPCQNVSVCDPINPDILTGFEPINPDILSAGTEETDKKPSFYPVSTQSLPPHAREQARVQAREATDVVRENKGAAPCPPKQSPTTSEDGGGGRKEGGLTGGVVDRPLPPDSASKPVEEPLNKEARAVARAVPAELGKTLKAKPPEFTVPVAEPPKVQLSLEETIAKLENTWLKALDRGSGGQASAA